MEKGLRVFRAHSHIQFLWWSEVIEVVAWAYCTLRNETKWTAKRDETKRNEMDCETKRNILISKEK